MDGSIATVGFTRGVVFMARRLLISGFIILLVLLLLNVYLYLDYSSVLVSQNQPPAPAGMKYLEYCGGGISNQLVHVHSGACIGDLPGMFARHVIQSLSIMIFVLFLFCYICAATYKYLKNKISVKRDN